MDALLALVQGGGVAGIPRYPPPPARLWAGCVVKVEQSLEELDCQIAHAVRGAISGQESKSVRRRIRDAFGLVGDHDGYGLMLYNRNGKIECEILSRSEVRAIADSGKETRRIAGQDN